MSAGIARYLCLLLPILCAAQILPVPQTAHTAKKPTGCPSSNEVEHNAIITFSHSNELNFFDYRIVTQYAAFYPNLLKSALQAEDYNITHLGSDEACGWQKAKSVYGRAGFEDRNHHGDIYWKYSDLRWEKKPTNRTEGSGWRAESIDHIPPRTGRLPLNSTIDGIAHILKVNEPAAEVYEFCNVLLWWALALAGMFIIATSAVIAHKGQEQTSTLDESSAGIELDTFTVPVQSPAVSPSRASLPTALPKSSHISMCSGPAASQGEHLEPPPSYSFDGHEQWTRNDG
ncbi:hypothetical protein ACN47E_005219 [Coniothyrium glycines]